MSQLYYGDTPLSQMPASYPASRITHESVSVTADGLKDEKALLNELWALVDFTKLTQNSCVKTQNSNGSFSIYRFNAKNISGNKLYFTMSQISAQKLNFYSIYMEQSNSALQAVEGGTFHDYSTEVESAGYKFILYY